MIDSEFSTDLLDYILLKITLLRYKPIPLKFTHLFTICKIDGKWEFAVWHRELSLVLCDNLEGWDGMGDGRGVQEAGGNICMPVAD